MSQAASTATSTAANQNSGGNITTGTDAPPWWAIISLGGLGLLVLLVLVMTKRKP